MVDLLKNVTAPQKVRDNRRPVGWSEFLRAFAELNMPFFYSAESTGQEHN